MVRYVFVCMHVHMLMCVHVSVMLYRYVFYTQGLILIVYFVTGPNGEPKITHGNTLVSELSLLEVVKVIDVSYIVNLYSLNIIY